MSTATCYPGIKCERGLYDFDSFRGTAEALVAAGLIRHDQLPGQPGRAKTLVHYLPDGTMVPPRTNKSAGRAPGTVSIFKKGSRRFEVRIFVSKDEQERRRAIWLREVETRNRAIEAEQMEAQLRKEAAERGETLEDVVLRRSGIGAQSKAEVRELACAYVEGLESGFTHGLQNLGAGYSFDQQTLLRVGAQFAAIRLLLRQAPVSFDPARRKDRIARAFEDLGLSPKQAPKRPTLRLVSG